VSGARFISHRGKRICHIDFSDAERAETQRIMEHAKKLIAAEPLKSVLTLTDVTGAEYDTETLRTLRSYTIHNRPYVKVGAVVGISGPMMRIVYMAVLALSKRRNLRCFEGLQEAKDWLATQ